MHKCEYCGASGVDEETGYSNCSESLEPTRRKITLPPPKLIYSPKHEAPASGRIRNFRDHQGQKIF